MAWQSVARSSGSGAPHNILPEVHTTSSASLVIPWVGRPSIDGSLSLSRFIFCHIDGNGIHGCNSRCTWFDLARYGRILDNLLRGHVLHRPKADLFTIVDLNSNVICRIPLLPGNLPNSKRVGMICVRWWRVMILRRTLTRPVVPELHPSFRCLLHVKPGSTSRS